MKIIVPLLKMQATALGPAAPLCTEERGFVTRSNMICKLSVAYGTDMKIRNVALWHKREHKGTKRNRKEHGKFKSSSLRCRVVQKPGFIWGQNPNEFAKTPTNPA